MKMARGVKVVQRITAHGRGAIEIGEGAQLGVYPPSGLSAGSFILKPEMPKHALSLGKM